MERPTVCPGGDASSEAMTFLIAQHPKPFQVCCKRRSIKLWKIQPRSQQLDIDRFKPRNIHDDSPTASAAANP
jgi:hypothetical protein